MGIIVILAVLAILAAVIGPMVFRQMMEARERATGDELVQIEAGLVAFFEDVGRFPTEAEGLTALVSDPGVSNWGGPYLSSTDEEPTVEVGRDAWNLPYTYDLYPVTDPADTATVLVVSGGRNRQLEAGAVGGTWTVGGSDDDLMGLVTATQLNREKTTATSAEQELMARAAQAYFRDHEAYPTSLNQLIDDYLDPGVGSDAIYDQWNRAYVLTADNTAVPPTLTISSLGPDGASGGGDDVDLDLISIIPGRRTSYYELAISQSVVTATSGTALTGDWMVDRATFNLAAVLANDGWGNPYEEKMSTRTLLSGGPDADYFTPDDNIPPGIVPDDVTPDGGGIEYEEGTAIITGPKCDQFAFDITNTSGTDIIISSLTLIWDSPTAFYSKVRIDGSLLLNANPKIGSGDVATLNSSFSLAAGATATVDIQGFVGADGKKIKMDSVEITIEFSDGSTFTFNTGSC